MAQLAAHAATERPHAYRRTQTNLGRSMLSPLRRPIGMPVRWRLALVSAGLTFAILLLFAGVAGALLQDRIRTDFDNGLRSTAADLARELDIRRDPLTGRLELSRMSFYDVAEVAASGHAAVRLVDFQGKPIGPIAGDAPFGHPSPDHIQDAGDYRIATQSLSADGLLPPVAYLQYGRDATSLRATILRMWLLLGLGVLGGTALALLAGLAVARRAMRPVSRLTDDARRIIKTRDPSIRIETSPVQDEIGELSRTIDEMLEGLAEAQATTEATLAREREFVADASHELRTPLTSVLANLELLEAELQGEHAEVAAAALRSTKRMSALVKNLLFLARADAGHIGERARVDLALLARSVLAELKPVARDHEFHLHALLGESVVLGNQDELYRILRNLVENAVRYTPSGTRVDVRVHARNGEAVVEVADDGPGVPPDVRQHIWTRFSRGGRDTAGHQGTGLGLAIVRTVAERHGGTVALMEDNPAGGARFVVRLPLAPPQDALASDPSDANGPTHAIDEVDPRRV